MEGDVILVLFDTGCHTFEHVQLRIVRDRSQIFVDIKSKEEHQSEWYSIDLVLTMVTGSLERSAFLNEQAANKLHENLDTVLRAFSPSEYQSTRAQLKLLARERAKRIFG